MVEPIRNTPYSEPALSLPTLPIRREDSFASSSISGGWTPNIFTIFLDTLKWLLRSLFCCKKRAPYSFFRQHDQPNQQIVYRLIKGGVKTNCELVISYKSALLLRLEAFDLSQKEQFHSMLMHVMEEEKVEQLLVDDLVGAKTLLDLGLVTTASILLDDKFYQNVLQSAFKNRGDLSPVAEEALKRCEQRLLKSVLGEATLAEQTKYDEHIAYLHETFPGLDLYQVMGAAEGLSQWEATTVADLLREKKEANPLKMKMEINLTDPIILAGEMGLSIPKGIRIQAGFTKSN